MLSQVSPLGLKPVLPTSEMAHIKAVSQKIRLVRTACRFKDPNSSQTEQTLPASGIQRNVQRNECGR